MKFRSIAEVQRYTCPFCARAVLADVQACTMFHQVPLCDAFAAAMGRFGLRATPVGRTAFVDPARVPRAKEGPS